MGFCARAGLLCGLLAAACQARAPTRACTGVDGNNPLVTGAAVLELMVFARPVSCQGPTVATGAGAPMAKHAFARGQAIELDLAAGQYALLLTTYADVTEATALGQGCTEVTVDPGARACFDLAVQAATAHGGACVSDWGCPGGAGGNCCGQSCADLARDVGNCGGCGAACDQTSTVGARCQAGACAFDACQAGRLDCDQRAADGCECAGSGCCGSACQSQHDNGVGGHFYDCVPLYTFNGDEAGAAYDSATQYSGGALILTCAGNTNADHATALCKTGSTSCVCWWYDGAGDFANAPGLVSVNPTTGDCWCPDPSSNAHWH